MHILILEDNKDDYALIVYHLKRAWQDIQIEWAQSLQQAFQLLGSTSNFDLALVDMKLPDGVGTELLIEIRNRNLPTPVVILTGSGNEEQAVAAMKAGADDYIVKKTGFFKNIPESIRFTINAFNQNWQKQNQIYNIIHIEHNVADIDLTQRHFHKYAPNFKFKLLHSVSEVVEQLANKQLKLQEYHAILMDYRLPGLNAIELIKIIRREIQTDIPIIIVTGHGNEEIAIQTLKLGADEYLVKRENYLFRLPSILISAIQKRELERQKSELSSSKEHYQRFFDNDITGDYLSTPDGKLLDCNHAFVAMLGYTSKEEILATSTVKLYPSIGNREEFLKELENNKSINARPIEMVTKDGKRIHAIENVIGHFNEKGKLVSFLGYMFDITQRIEALQELQESELRYRSLFVNNHTVMLQIDPQDGRILDANPAAVNFYGWPYEKLVSKSIFSINDLPQKEVRKKIKLAQGNSQAEFAFQHKLANGTIKDVEVHTSPVKIKNKTILFSIVHDISERKKAEEQIEKLNEIIAQNPVSIIMTDTNGIIQYVNDAVIKYTGFSESELIGNTPRLFKSGAHDLGFYDNLWQTILSGKIWRDEMYNRRNDGTFYWEEAIISPLKNKNGIITNFVAQKTDITERKRYLEEIVAAKERAEKSDQLKSAFLANMSHEVRTPMNAILGFIEMLNDDTPSAERKEFINVINTNAYQLLNIINDVLIVSRIETDDLPIRKTVKGMFDFMSELLKIHQHAALEKGIEIHLDIANLDTGIQLDYDWDKLKQILDNLISNAIKYTEHGVVEFGAKLCNNSLNVFVKDSGIGIPPDELPSIFDRFYRGTEGQQRAVRGTGLGLSIVKGLVKLLDGNIDVESLLGKGTTVQVVLPAGSQLIQETSSKKQSNNDNQILSKSILIVEDERDNFIYLSMVLKSIGHRITWAKNGQEAISLAESESFDIIFMDIKMPVMDGIQATQIIHQKFPEIPVIMQSAFSLQHDRELAFKAGCKAFLTKPISRNDIIGTLNKLLSGK